MAVTAEAPEQETEAEPVAPPVEVPPPDDDESPEGEPAPPSPLDPDTPEPPPPLSEKQLNEAMTKLDKEARRHRDRLSEIMGEEAILLVPCPLCEEHLAGWRFGRQPSEAEWRQITAEVYGVENVEYVTADYAQPCDACAQLGQIRTGSKVPGRETIPCRKCSGFGYVTADATPPLAVAAPAPEPTLPAFSAPAEQPPERDFMGRTRDDPNFGRVAGYEV